MSIAVRIAIKQSSILEALVALSMDKDDKAAVLDEIGINLVENTRLRFSDQVTPEGEAWVQSLRAINQGGDTGRDTGRLLNSINHFVSGNSVEVGTNVAYAMPFHFGAHIEAKNSPWLKFQVPGGGWAQKASVDIPARPFLGISDEDEETVLDIISGFLGTRAP